MDGRKGSSFEDEDVVGNYLHRPPYPDGIFAKLIEIAPAHDSLLDIGCGPGKIARPLSHHFASVTAVDPSRAMIALARSLPSGNRSNIEWIEGLAESFPIERRRFDLTVAAASIHWIDHSLFFARLSGHVSAGHRVAVISGDDAHDPPWQPQWLDFLTRWVPIATGRPFDHEGKAIDRASYREYLDIEGSTVLPSEPFEQTVEDFVRCQHSRDTFASSRLGAISSRFDEELASLLSPYAIGGQLTYRTATRLVWGSIRKS